MKTKSSVRYFIGKEVRAVFDNDTNSWCFAAMDISSILANTNSPRKYWNTLKRRNKVLADICKQYKMFAADGKKYLTDALDYDGIKILSTIIPSANNETLQEWLKGGLDPIDEQSKKRAYELYENNIVKDNEIGTTKALQKIHAYLFEGLYDFAGQIRRLTISKGGFVFANGDFLPETLKEIDKMKEDSIDDIIHKYVEMNVAHPFMEGNGRSARIWLDLILKKRLSKCVDWASVNKEDYLNAMRLSPYDQTAISKLIKGSLTDKISDREIFFKGVDASYYYEEE